VNLCGDYLLGDDLFVIEAGESKTYQVIYSPLLPKTHSGSISFYNTQVRKSKHQKLRTRRVFDGPLPLSLQVGEFWYKLKLSSIPADPVELEQLSAPVGSTASTHVMIENPLGIEAKFAVKNTNRRNFTVRPQQVRTSPCPWLPALIPRRLGP